jgi:hypothetical protein
MDPPGTVKFLMWMSVHDETAALTAAGEYVPIVQTGSVEVVVLYLARGDQWRHWRAVQQTTHGLGACATYPSTRADSVAVTIACWSHGQLPDVP